MKRISLLALGVMLAWGLSASAEMVIDNFDEGLADMSVNDTQTNSTVNSTGLSTANTIGGARYTDLSWEQGTENNILLEINKASSGKCVYSSPSSVRGYYTVTYGRSTDLNTDLTESGANGAFKLIWSMSDMASPVTITVTNTGGLSSFTFNSPDGGFTLNPLQTQLVYFASFTGFDFSHVDRIDVKVHGVVSFDGTLNEITVGVPEPATAGIVALVTLGLFGWRRWRAYHSQA
jgi:hypothetical protein